MVGFFLNAISIVSFLTVKEMRNPSNFFVFNLAVADLCLNINGLTAAYASYLRYEGVLSALSVWFIFLNHSGKTSSVPLKRKQESRPYNAVFSQVLGNTELRNPGENPFYAECKVHLSQPTQSH